MITVDDMPYKEKEIEKKYYTIGEIADELEINTSAIRFWEEELAKLNPSRRRNGNRRYTVREREMIHDIYRLRVKRPILTMFGVEEFLQFKYG